MLLHAIKIPPDAPTEGRKSKLSITWGQNFPRKRCINIFLFCVLEANYITEGISNLILDRVPFPSRINTSYIPSQDIPAFG